MKRTKPEEIWVNRDDGRALDTGAEAALIEYHLNNGQRDEYPA